MSTAKLAIKGGTPVRSTPLPGTSRAMGQSELDALAEVVRSGQLGRHGGTKVRELERRFAEIYGMKHAIAVSSGSAAVHTAVAAIDPNPGDEIITTPCSDFGTILGILFQNAVPVFADLDPETFCLDPASVERLVTKRTRAILPVHLFGGLADVERLIDVGRRHRVQVIEDCAQAQLAEIGGRLAGTIGDIGAFSFNNTKHLNCGEGGMVVTNDDNLARRMRLFADKAWPRDVAGRFSLFLGQNYRLNELEAAVALVGLDRLAENVAARRHAAERIRDAASGIPGIRVPREIEGACSSYWILHLLLEESLDIESVVAALGAEGVPFSAKYVTPLYTWPVLAEKRTYGDSGFPFDSPYVDKPVSYGPGLSPGFEKARERLILLPVDEQWTDHDAEDIIAALRKVLGAFSEGVAC